LPLSLNKSAAAKFDDGRSANESSSVEVSSADAPAERLIAAAGPVFAQRGFDGATIREIAKRADVNVAAVSYYFGDKMGLYRAVIAAIRQNREREFPTPILGDAPPEQSLYRLINTLLSRMLSGDEEGWEALLMMREMQHPTAALEEMIQEYFKPIYVALCDTIEKLLEASCTQQHAGRDVEPPSDWRSQSMVPQMALGVVGQCLHYRIGRPVIERLIDSEILQDHYDVDSLCRHITASTLAACGHQNMPSYRQWLETEFSSKRS
jgi:AcrR family transcriptional regulator